jgi:hypothetical protein
VTFALLFTLFRLASKRLFPIFWCVNTDTWSVKTVGRALFSDPLYLYLFLTLSHIQNDILKRHIRTTYSNDILKRHKQAVRTFHSYCVLLMTCLEWVAFARFCVCQDFSDRTCRERAEMKTHQFNDQDLLFLKHRVAHAQQKRETG